MTFSKYTNYNKKSGVSSVKIGSNKPVLEVEFNEIQEVQREKLKNALNTLLGDGIYGIGTMSYTSGKFKIQNEKILFNGELIQIDSLEISASLNDTIYLGVWDKEISFQDPVREYGNEQGIILPNYIIDSRYGVETSRRVVTAFNLFLNTNDNSKKYIKLCKMPSAAGGKIIEICPTIYEVSGHKIHIGSVSPLYRNIWIDTTGNKNELKFRSSLTDSWSLINANNANTLENLTVAQIRSGVTASNVGLDNVKNYDIATKAEAEEALADNKYMTPLKVKQAIDKFKLTKVSQLTNDAGYLTTIGSHDHDSRYNTKEEITTLLNGKVSTETGKRLSTNDYSNTEKNKLSGITAQATKTESSTFNGYIKINGNEVKVYSHPDKHSLSIIEETTDLKIMTAAERTKLAGIASGANNYTHPSSHSANMIGAGTMIGKVLAQNNTDYGKQIRNITLSTSNPSGGSSGDVWIKYRA